MVDRTRILFAIPELDSGGPDRVFYELIKGIDRDVFKPILLISCAGGRYYSSLPDDVEICEIGGGRYPLWHFARAIDRLKPDLIISTLRMNTTASAARILQRHRPALVTRQANAIETNFKELRKRSSLKYGMAEWLVTQLLKIPDALIAQSKDMGIELERHVSPRQKVIVIGNPINIEAVIADSNNQKKLKDPTRFGDPALIAVGRLTPQKGFDILISAFAEVNRTHPLARLTIIGDGPDRIKLESQAKSLGVSDAVRLLGHSDGVLAEIAAADIFVSSSRYEGFSNAILEALALGKPVVATNCEGGTKDMIIGGKTGILARPDNTASLSESMISAIQQDLSELQKAGRTHVEANFSHQHIISQYEELFTEILGNVKTPRMCSAELTLSDKT